VGAARGFLRGRNERELKKGNRMKEYRKNDVLEQVKQSVTDDVQLEFDF